MNTNVWETQTSYLEFIGIWGADFLPLTHEHVMFHIGEVHLFDSLSCGWDRSQSFTLVTQRNEMAQSSSVLCSFGAVPIYRWKNDRLKTCRWSNKQKALSLCLTGIPAGVRRWISIWTERILRSKISQDSMGSYDTQKLRSSLHCQSRSESLSQHRSAFTKFHKAFSAFGADLVPRGSKNCSKMRAHALRAQRVDVFLLYLNFVSWKISHAAML